MPDEPISQTEPGAQTTPATTSVPITEPGSSQQTQSSSPNPNQTTAQPSLGSQTADPTKQQSSLAAGAGTTEPVALESLAMPEGYTMSQEQSDAFLGVLNNHMSPTERAQALINLHAQTMQTSEDAAWSEWNTQQEEWINEVKADQDLGGAKLDDTLGRIGKLVDKFGSSEFRDVLDATGAGNNIHVIRFLNNIAAQLGESTMASGQPQAGEPDLLRSMYPSMFGGTQVN